MELLYGRHAVQAVLSARRRTVQKLYLTSEKQLKDWRELVPSQLKIEILSGDQLSRLCQNSHHQGIALAAASYPYVSDEEILHRAKRQLVFLDQVTDPMNLGAILRSAAAFGVEGVILPQHGSASITPLVQKVSVGNSEKLKIALVKNAAAFVKKARKADFWSVATVSHEGESLNRFSFPQKTLLVMGGEEKGIRPLVLKNCDFAVHLPIAENVESLNVSVAFALFAYQCSQQMGITA